jgi:Rrf2 family protein
MLSKTAEYALRAVATVARVKEDRPVLAREIATLGKIPGKYLSKVMRDLVHAGVFTSTRGIGGGFRLRRKAETIKLADVIRPFDDVLAARRCPFGNTKCSDDNPCSMHDQWKPVSDAVRYLLEKTTVADIIRKDVPIRFDSDKGKKKGRKVKAASPDRA